MDEVVLTVLGSAFKLRANYKSATLGRKHEFKDICRVVNRYEISVLIKRISLYFDTDLGQSLYQTNFVTSVMAFNVSQATKGKIKK